MANALTPEIERTQHLAYRLVALQQLDFALDRLADQPVGDPNVTFGTPTMRTPAKRVLATREPKDMVAGGASGLAVAATTIPTGIPYVPAVTALVLGIVLPTVFRARRLNREDTKRATALLQHLDTEVRDWNRSARYRTLPQLNREQLLALSDHVDRQHEPARAEFVQSFLETFGDSVDASQVIDLRKGDIVLTENSAHFVVAQTPAPRTTLGAELS